MPTNASQPVRFVVLMMGGSVGSVWLQQMLSSHPLVRCDGELFNSRPMSEIRRWFSQPEAPHLGAVGTRLKFTDLQGQLHFGRPIRAGNRWPALRKLLRETESKLVCLYRRNYVKHAVGELRHQLQYEACVGKVPNPWSDQDGNCSRQLAKALPLGPRRFRSGDWLPGLVKMVGASRAQQRDLLAACSGEHGGSEATRLLAYEDLAYVPAEMRLARLQALARWLVGPARCDGACERFRAFGASVTKVTPPELRRVVSNFQEVEARIRTAFGAHSTEVQMLRDGTS